MYLGSKAQRRTGTPACGERQNKGSNAILALGVCPRGHNPQTHTGCQRTGPVGGCGVGNGVVGSRGRGGVGQAQRHTLCDTGTKHTGRREAEKTSKNKQNKQNKQTKLEIALTPSCSGCHGALSDWTARLWVRVERRWKGPSDDLEEVGPRLERRWRGLESR